MGALYFGVGKSAGSLFGGLIIDHIGERNTFRCFSTVSLVTASVYFCFTFFMDKRRKEEDTEAYNVTKDANNDDEHRVNKKNSVSNDIQIGGGGDNTESRCT